jgi:hypothetical protein
MCYASRVMLRGRCSCAISGRPTPSSAPKNPPSPLFPLHPRNSPVTPLFPLHTQKQGGGWYLSSPSVLPSSALGVYLDPVGVSSVGRRSCSAFSFSPLPLCALRVRGRSRHGRDGESSFLSDLSLATRLPSLSRASRGALSAKGHWSLTPMIPAPLATAALRVVPAPIFTTTSRIHVGAPTILFRQRTTASQQFPDRRAMLSSNWALLTVDCELLFSPNSNHSRTSERVARKSNYSRTYAKTGGWGASCKICSPITLLFSFDVLTTQLRTIVGAPTIACLCQRRSLPLLMPALSPIDVHSGCRRERTPESLHTLIMTNATRARRRRVRRFPQEIKS